MHLVLVETAGNQRYIFATRRRRENVGASELLRRAGTDWVLDALRETAGVELRREDVLDPGRNGPIERTGSPEVVYLASGKALLLVPQREDGVAIVRAVTERTLREAPGLQVMGVVSPELRPVDRISARELAETLRGVHAEARALRARRTSPAERSPRLPVVAQCAYGGWAAEVLVRDEEGGQRPASREVACKSDWGLVREAYRRMGWDAAAQTNDRSAEESWAAIFHADGNGFGRLFLRFEDHIDNPGGSARTYLDKLRRFSTAIDEATNAAFREAVLTFGGPERAEALPLVLAGDDVTVHCEKGSAALDIAAAYLSAFERLANDPGAQGGILREVASRALGGARLTASGGVVLIKPHFPFSAAYELAEQLCAEAKRECRARGLAGVSALSLHVLFDSSATSLDDIRRRAEHDGARLYGSPYVVSSDGAADGWLAAHSYDRLRRAVRAVLQTRASADGDEGVRAVPTSQLNAWADAARLGKEQCDAAYELAKHRYPEATLKDLEGDAGSLFWTETDPEGRERHATLLVDALALARISDRREVADAAAPSADDAGRGV
ncbi:MAG: hypothetical protein QMD96_06275 [Anaerosomatales bacterium]|nr:hypothetical protein [Anaerosomatales bacterium]